MFLRDFIDSLVAKSRYFNATGEQFDSHIFIEQAEATYLYLLKCIYNGNKNALERIATNKFILVSFGF